MRVTGDQLKWMHKAKITTTTTPMESNSYGGVTTRPKLP